SAARESGPILGTEVIPTLRDILSDTLDRIRAEVFDAHRDEPASDRVPPEPAESAETAEPPEPPEAMEPAEPVEAAEPVKPREANGTV
ncbi:MAG TPA: hypothetical protein VGD91_06020, partial [Trebonia sp.]